MGGFATQAEAETALRKVLDRLGPGGGRATITLAEFVDEYLDVGPEHVGSADGWLVAEG